MKTIFAVIFAAILLVGKVEAACDRTSDLVVRYNAKIEFCNATSPFWAELSNFQEPNSVGNPYITFNDGEKAKNTHYTILMLDPDAPSRENPFLSDFLHFGAINIEQDQLKKGINAKRSENYDVIMEYMPPQPPLGSGVHHYHVMVLKQCDKLHDVHVSQRNNFDHDGFIKKHQLQKTDMAALITENRG